jgi:hypothetical protein
LKRTVKIPEANWSECLLRLQWLSQEV